MTSHEQLAEELVRFALGELPAGEHEALAQHLAGCPECRNELAEIQAGIGVFSLSALGPAPPARARERLLAAIAPPKHKFSRMARPRWMLVPALASVFLAVIAILLVAENYKLRNQVTSESALLRTQETELQRAQMVAETLMAQDSVHVSLVSAGAKAPPEGKVFYLRRKNSLVFMASNLQTPPPTKVYELWIIPAGGKPVPFGTFRPDSHGSATMVMDKPLPENAQTFAVTLEPDPGSEQPTSTPFIVGTGE